MVDLLSYVSILYWSNYMDITQLFNLYLPFYYEGTIVGMLWISCSEFGKVGCYYPSDKKGKCISFPLVLYHTVSLKVKGYLCIIEFCK